MAQPSTSLDFTGGTQIDPGATKRNTTGYVPAEKVPAQHLNWFLGNISAWITYLKNLAGEALTWTAKHTFSAGLSSGVAAGSANDLVRLNEAATKNMAGGVITNHGTPSASGDVVNKGFLAPSWAALPTLSWSAHATITPQQAKDALGFIRLRGALLIPSGGYTVCTFPVGSRPSAQRGGLLAYYLNGVPQSPNLSVAWEISAAGVLSIWYLTGGPNSNTYVLLDGIAWYADQ